MALSRFLDWFRKDKPKMKVKEYKGSTALSIQNPRNPDLWHIFYVKKWGSTCDGVVEDLEGAEYELVKEA